MGVCNCSMFCCMLLYVLSSFAIILMEKRELVAFLPVFVFLVSSDCCVALSLPSDCLQFVIVVFSDHTHLIFLCITPKILL